MEKYPRRVSSFNLGPHGYPLLTIDQFWYVQPRTAVDGAEQVEWTDFYALCSGRILSLNENAKVVEVSLLPPNAVEIEFAATRGQDEFHVPTPPIRDTIIFYGSYMGGDILLLLANGGQVIRGIDYLYSGVFDPNLSFTTLSFYEPAHIAAEPGDFRKLGDMEALPLELL